jgi:hypothetical protein
LKGFRNLTLTLIRATESQELKATKEHVECSNKPQWYVLFIMAFHWTHTTDLGPEAPVASPVKRRVDKEESPQRPHKKRKQLNGVDATFGVISKPGHEKEPPQNGRGTSSSRKVNGAVAKSRKLLPIWPGELNRRTKLTRQVLVEPMPTRERCHCRSCQKE